MKALVIRKYYGIHIENAKLACIIYPEWQGGRTDEKDLLPNM